MTLVELLENWKLLCSPLPVTWLAAFQALELPWYIISQVEKSCLSYSWLRHHGQAGHYITHTCHVQHGRES